MTRFAIVPATTEHPDATRLVLPEDEAIALVAGSASCIAHLDDGVVTRLELPTRDGSATPPLWFVEAAEPQGTPPAASLVAFTGHDVETGTLRPRMPRGVTSADQLAAARWYVGSGEVDQVYVAPQHRRRGIASALLLAVGTLSVARGTARVWGDGQRTADGERLRNASPWAHRAAPQTHLAPPMTPFDER